MAKICLIGAGSTVFAQSIIGDVLSPAGPGRLRHRPSDIDPERLNTSAIVARRIGDSLGLDNVKVEASLDRREGA